MSSVLAVLEAGSPTPSLEAYGLAGSVAESLAMPVDAVELPPDPNLDAAAAALAEAVDGGSVAAVVAPGTPTGAELMAHLAARTDLPLAANCTAATPHPADHATVVRHADNARSAPHAMSGTNRRVEPEVHDQRWRWGVTRVRGGGVLLEDAELTAPVALITTAPGMLPPAEDAPAPRPLTVPAEPGDRPSVRAVDRIGAGGGITLSTAPIVVSGGRGIGSSEGFAVLDELAELIGGAVGCSRVATNNGWRPHSDQVGQTGTKVSPKLYIAAGISGATQHWAGCMGSQTILAINTDADAPMVTRADYAVIGDALEVLRAVTDELRRRRTR